MRELLPYLGIVILIAFSAFFSGSEIAFASVNTLRLQNKAEKGSKPAQVAHYICQQYDKALCTILIGNNLVNIASSSLATVIALQLVGDSGAIYATGVMTVLILTFGEIMPKIVAKDQSDGFVLLAAYPLRLLMLVTKPLVIAITWILDRIAKLWGGTPEPDPMTADELILFKEYFTSYQLDESSYKAGFTGLTGDSFTGDEALISGATVSSDAVRVATEDAFAAFAAVNENGGEIG